MKFPKSKNFTLERKKTYVWLFATLWTVARQAPLSMGFSWQEYWSGLPFPFPGNLPDQGIEPGFPDLQADSLPSEPPGKPYEKNTVAQNNTWKIFLKDTIIIPFYT